MPREVPLGGTRAMTVRRTLPTRRRPLIGAWCFLDHYGPNEVSERGGMLVPPHPHAGLQTVTWLFEGEVEHRDSGGGHAFVHPGEIGLMTSGYGTAHSEVSTPATTILHGVQLWVALPAAALTLPRSFMFRTAPKATVDVGSVTVFVGELAGVDAEVPMHTPLVAAEIVLAPHAELALDVRPDFEHGVLVDTGDIAVFDTTLRSGELGFVAHGASELRLTNTTGLYARAVLIGGTPFEEQIAMWWNFVGRTHEDIVEMREQWQANSDRFGDVVGFTGDVMRLDAPPMPRVRILSRGNPPITT